MRERESARESTIYAYGALGGQKMVSDSSDVLQHPSDMLGIEPRSSARAVIALNH